MYQFCLCDSKLLRYSIHSIGRGGPVCFCGLTSASLGGSIPSVGTGLWTQSTGPGTSTLSNSALGTSTATATLPGIYTYTWTISNGTCSPSAATITVTYNNAPDVASVGADQNLCGTLTTASLGGNIPVNGTGTSDQTSRPLVPRLSAMSIWAQPQPQPRSQVVILIHGPLPTAPVLQIRPL